jgi:hypothetical protein
VNTGLWIRREISRRHRRCWRGYGVLGGGRRPAQVSSHLAFLYIRGNGLPLHGHAILLKSMTTSSGAGIGEATLTSPGHTLSTKLLADWFGTLYYGLETPPGLPAVWRTASLFPLFLVLKILWPPLLLQRPFFFIEYVRELHILVLSRGKTVPYKYSQLTQNRALRGWELHRS